MRGKVVHVLIAALLALGIASCGESGPLSRAELVKQANAICKERRANITALQRRYRRDFTGAIIAAVPMMEKNVAKLAHLKPPKELEARYREFVTGERAEVDQIKRAIAAFKAHSRPPASPGVDVMHRRADLKRELGLEACV